MNRPERPGETSEAIIKAAMEIFSEAGYDGARVDEIARRAGVNKASLYYHIGDKKALYTRVLQNVFGDAAERIAHNMKRASGPVEKLRTYVRNFALTLDRHPELTAIMMRENISGGRNFPDEVARDLIGIVTMLNDILEEGLRNGVFIRTIPFVVHLMIIGAMGLFKTNGPLRTRDAFRPLFKDFDERVSGMISEEIEKLVVRAVSA
jgi:TetR/AcrR family transcriptional regulator